MVAEAGEQGVHRDVETRHELRRRKSCRVDGRRPEVGKEAVHACDPDDRRRQTLCGGRVSGRGLGEQRPRRRRGDAATWSALGTRADGRDVCGRGASAAASVSDRSAHWREFHEERGPGERRPPRGIRGARGPLRCVSIRPDLMNSPNPFDASLWRPVSGFEDLTDITYHRHVSDGTVRVAFNRPEVRNAFRPHTVDELYRALDHARMSPDVGVVLLTGNGPSPKDGGWAFCSGGDQRIRGRSGYQYASGDSAETVDAARAGRLHILEVQRLIRFMPKVVICLVNGWAAGGGHSLHVVCDLTLASREHARFKQTDADVGSFDGGFGSAYLARQVGQKFAREIFFLGDTYDAAAAHRMGMVNAVVPHAELETAGVQWAAEINAKSPQAQRMLKYAFNLLDDGLVGQQLFAGEATRLAYMTDEAVEGRDAFLEKRPPDWSQFPRYF